MLVVECGESLAIVDGLAYDEHCGEGEFVVVDNLREVFQYASIDFLIRPGEVIAGSNGRIFWIFLQELLLHIIDNRSREEDTHRALALGQQM